MFAIQSVTSILDGIWAYLPSYGMESILILRVLSALSLLSFVLSVLLESSAHVWRLRWSVQSAEHSLLHNASVSVLDYPSIIKWGKVLPILKEQDTSFESINVKLKSQNLSVLDIGGRETCLDKNQGNLLNSI